MPGCDQKNFTPGRRGEVREGTIFLGQDDLPEYGDMGFRAVTVQHPTSPGQSTVT